jgi:hypothetical protein
MTVTGTISFPRIGMQCELRHDQRGSLDIFHGQIHFSVRIVENAEA